MDPLKRHARLRAGSLMEAIVASVLFLIVFTVSLETLSRLTRGGETGELPLVMNNALQACERAYMERPSADAPKRETYPWGTIDIRMEPYAGEGELQTLTLTATGKKNRQCIQWRRILHHTTSGDETQ